MSLEGGFRRDLQQRYPFLDCEVCVGTMSYRRTKICFVLSWDVLVGMLPIRPGRSNSLWKLQSMACCSCGDFTPINRNQFCGRRWTRVFLGHFSD